MTTTDSASGVQQRDSPMTGAERDSDMAAMSRQAHRAILNRLTNDLFTAVANDESAVPESARLTAWLQADFLPWAHDRQVQANDPALRSALRADRNALAELENELADAYGEEAADLARAVFRDATVLLARLD